jgi:hypothetical protein
MDPVEVKFLQLIGAEIFGAILSLVGLYMFFRGITGKSDLILVGKGVKAKLTNSAPGTIICLIGVGLIIFSLHSSSVTREETALSPERVLELWSANSKLAKSAGEPFGTPANLVCPKTSKECSPQVVDSTCPKKCH